MTLKATSVFAATLAAASLANSAQAQGIDYAKTVFTTQRLAPNVYILTGSPGTDLGHPEAAGGRIGLLVGPDGVLMVDASYAPLSEKIVEAIRKISPSPIRYLVDTHSHPDHTGGNPKFAKMGAVILAREETWRVLSQPAPPALVAAIGAAASSTDPARLPVITYGLGAPVKIRMDGEVVDLVPIRAAHTGGDTVVRFENADVMMIGDFYRNYGYPFVDSARGGTFKGVIEAVDLIEGLAGPNTKLAPGHGTIITRSDLVAYRAMIVDVQARVQEMVDEGKTLPEVLQAKLTAPYDARVPGGLVPLPGGNGTSADRFVAALYGELKAKK